MREGIRKNKDGENERIRMEEERMKSPKEIRIDVWEKRGKEHFRREERAQKQTLCGRIRNKNMADRKCRKNVLNSKRSVLARGYANRS